jgi:uncharacterized membrane protein YbaN (DUF454 family)
MFLLMCSWPLQMQVPVFKFVLLLKEWYNAVEKKLFETSKTTQNGKYKCSYFIKCGLTRAILSQNLA